MHGGQRQGTAIARATHWANKLILLDEPTAALGAAETASDDFKAGFKVAKWRMFCHPKTLQISQSRLKQLCSDKASLFAACRAN